MLKKIVNDFYDGAFVVEEDSAVFDSEECVLAVMPKKIVTTIESPTRNTHYITQEVDGLFQIDGTASIFVYITIEDKYEKELLLVEGLQICVPKWPTKRQMYKILEVAVRRYFKSMLDNMMKEYSKE